jgi:hypothetical protein
MWQKFIIFSYLSLPIYHLLLLISPSSFLFYLYIAFYRSIVGELDGYRISHSHVLDLITYIILGKEYIWGWSEKLETLLVSSMHFNEHKWMWSCLKPHIYSVSENCLIDCATGLNLIHLVSQRKLWYSTLCHRSKYLLWHSSDILNLCYSLRVRLVKCDVWAQWMNLKN